MASITYRSQRIIPCPFISYSKDYIKNTGGSVMVTGSESTDSSIPGVADDETNSRDAIQASPAIHRKSDDHIIGVTHNITLRGTLVAGMKGSPNIDKADNLFNTFYDASMPSQLGRSPHP